MQTENETRIGRIYALFVVLFLCLAISFLLCDFRVIPDGICGEFNTWVNYVTDKFGQLAGFKG